MNASAKTNKAIIEFYKIENNITCPLHTYTKWKELGYQVKKGEKSQHHILIWKACTKKVVDTEKQTEITTTKMIMKVAHFFTLSQVEKVQK